MKKNIFLSGVLIAFILVILQLNVHAQVDSHATPETRALYKNLKKTAGTGIIFGAQTATSMGKGWTSDQSNPLQSDVQKSTGDFPGLFGFDFTKWNFNIDKGWRTDTEQVKEIYRRGGIITFSWHTPNLVTGESCKDTTGNPLSEILPGGSKNRLFNSMLDSIADFAHAITVDGVQVPIIFRPFHENTGKWFWWGSQNKPEEFIKLFRYVVDYLKDKKNVHSFLYAFSPSKPENTERYNLTYPGDDYVDILGYDCYLSPGSDENISGYSSIVVNLAKQKGKIAAITEVGCREGIQNATNKNWFSDNLLDRVRPFSGNSGLAYCLTWHNSNKSYWIPLKDDLTYADFVKFYNDKFTWFLKDLPNMYK